MSCLHELHHDLLHISILHDIVNFSVLQSLNRKFDRVMKIWRHRHKIMHMYIAYQLKEEEEICPTPDFVPEKIQR